MYEHRKVQALIGRYPYMFRQPEMLDIYAGWFDLLETLCADVHARLQGCGWTFQFSRIKEKFGVCRIYYQLEPPRHELETTAAVQELASLRAAVDGDIDRMQTASGSRCMVCGRDATTRAHGAALATLCEQHALSEVFRDPWAIGKLPLTVPSEPVLSARQAAEVQTSRLEFVRRGWLIDSTQFGRAWGASQDVLAQACERKELFRLKVGEVWFYPAVFVDLAHDDVHQVNRFLQGDDDAGKFIFWYRGHGGLGGKDVRQALLNGMLERVLELALGWSEERGLFRADQPS